MDFGICFKGDIDAKRTVKLAQAAEAGGFSYVWTFDSHVLWKEAVVMLSVLAANTEKVKLGPLVTNPAVRSLDVTASWFSTLNQVSGGRAICGIGRGDSSRRVMGQKPTTIKRMMESVEIIRDLAEGKEREVDGVNVQFPWATDEKLPMWVAGYGPKVLQASGKDADGIVLQIAEENLCEWFIEQVKAGAKEAGRDESEIEYMVAAPVYISDDIEKCREQVKWFPAMVGNHIADLITNNSIGVPEDLLKAVEGRKGYDYKHHADKDAGHLEWVTDAVVDGFSVIGTTEQIITKIKSLRDKGVDQFCIYLMCEDEENIVDVFSKEVIPAING